MIVKEEHYMVYIGFGTVGLLNATIHDVSILMYISFDLLLFGIYSAYKYLKEQLCVKN